MIPILESTATHVDRPQIHSLRKLDIPWQKKVGVCSVFVLGFIATVTSVVRLQYLVRLKGVRIMESTSTFKNACNADKSRMSPGILDT